MRTVSALFKLPYLKTCTVHCPLGVHLLCSPEHAAFYAISRRNLSLPTCCTLRVVSRQSYSEYLGSHGGSSNAYTDTEDTVYYFDVSADYLRGALDRFAQFFIAPQVGPATWLVLLMWSDQIRSDSQGDNYEIPW